MSYNYQSPQYEQQGMERPTMQLLLMIINMLVATVLSVWMWKAPYWPVTGRLQHWLGPMYQYTVGNGMQVPSEGLAITAVVIAVIVGIVLGAVLHKKSGISIFLGALLGALFSNIIYMAIIVAPILSHL